MLARLLESSTRRCPPPFCLAKDSSPTISEPVRPRTELVNGASPANQDTDIAVQALYQSAQLQLRQPALWSELASVAGEALGQLGPQDCVMLCWSMARARHKDPRVFHALLQRVSGCSRQLGPDSISCLLWSCARVGHYHHASVTALVLAAAGSMERFSPRALARCLWACGALRHYEPRLLRAARVRALASMHQFEPHSCVLVMCALAKFGVQDEQLAAAVAGQALQALPGFTMQGLANMAWAVAKLQQQGGQQQQQRLLRVSSSSKGRKQQQDIAVQQVQRRLLAGICAAAAPRLATAKPQEVCNLLWACAIMKLQHQGFLEAAGARLAAVAEDASPRDLAQAVWAFEVLQYRRKAVQQVLVLQALNKLHLFGAQALSNWAWAVASAGMQLPRGLPAAVAQQFQVLLPQLTAQGTATTLWALGKMGKAALTPQGALVVAALRQLQVLGVSGCSQARKAQLHEALVLLATEWGMVAWGDDGGLGWSNTTSSSSSSSRTGAQAAPCRGSPQPQGAADSIQPGEAGAAGSTHQHCVVQPPIGAASVLSGRLVRQCAAAWQEQQAEASLSQVEEEVAQALQSMGLQPLLQRWVQPQDSSSSSSASSRPGRELGGWSHHTLRVAVGVAGASLGAGRRPVAIEVLPPAAVSSSWPSRVLGRTALGQRCLQAAGWQVVCISWEEWEGLAQQRGAQRQLLQRVLGLIGS
ncbi:hypothetical protein OEZ85_008146 [Tetradesmus obliquus]|uniref:RAP domain-containing protein n=1 Tax=Tetradesmus obliquus TaxID=3088 RepID=A0ABY8TI12_TETOB|nr:hypothetical protein OEZ85_008146 [Tetradesmus obliquus]